MADKKSAQELIDIYKNLDNLINDDLRKTNEIFNAAKYRALELEKIRNNQSLINDLKSKEITLNQSEQKQLREIEAETRKLIENAQKHNKVLERRKVIQNELTAQLKIGLRYLMDSDKAIKSTILNLGLSGSKADAMRASFEGSAGYAARLGGSLADVGTIMEGYADETGRARAMSADMVKDITAIGYGTGLGIEQATKLGAQFEYIGLNAKGTMDYVQGVVDTSERMGVNTTKVLKNVSDNFKKLNTYTFQQGVKGFAQMAMYAEKFKIDITQALNAADVAKTLEGAIDLTAQLQVMGGEFAKTDPFEMLFLARNDPAKFTEKIADMTKGLVSFRKMADGSFEKFISPADRDRIAAVEKSMGMEAGSMVIIAQRQADIQKMRQQMAGTGLSDEQKKLIEGAAQWDQKTGKFQVELGGHMKNVSELTKDQADAFKTEQVSLEKRAEEAMNFEKAFQATIEELKSALLPILKTINTALSATREFLRPAIDWLQKGDAAWLKVAGMFITAGLLWKTVSIGLGGVASGLKQTVANRVVGQSAASLIPAKGAGSSGLALQRQGIGAGAAAKGAGMKRMGTGVGAGAAMAGAGAGIMLAAKGLSQLADSMSKLTPEQAKSLERIAMTLAITFPIAAIGITLAGKAAEASALGLIVLGGAIALVGAGIYLATTGIGNMGEGLAKMNESGGGAGKQLGGVALGIGAITLAMAGGGLVSLMAFNAGLKRMAKNSGGIEKIGTAFASIQAVLSGSKDDFTAVEKAVKSIGSANVKGGGYFAELSNLLSKPLQVEFANKGRVSMTNDITLNLDGQRFMNKAYDVNIAVQKHESLKHAKGS